MANRVVNGIVNGVVNDMANDVANSVTNGVANNVANGVANNVTNGMANGAFQHHTVFAERSADFFVNTVCMVNGVANGVANNVTNGMANGAFQHGEWRGDGVVNGVTNNVMNGMVNNVENGMANGAFLSQETIVKGVSLLDGTWIKFQDAKLKSWDKMEEMSTLDNIFLRLRLTDVPLISTNTDRFFPANTSAAF
ncbi:hypothetical protein BDP27DRAFT_1375824 [Rhodocollybia butyracea]|uniref:Uncharacterized protein n=1 Tax=Rhodocollybia butyracea TaxID=206335 RepID=A0A9P5P1Q0_9AGAR|nr:hypothetical protein BDP27DRAFT_1375824 [Rhodocollybia butyracea]